jgi:heterotetrameric sarcosine oxidase gamma subunit
MERASMADPPFIPRPPFAGLPAAPTGGRGVIATVRNGLGLATVLARKGETALAELLRDRFGLDLPQGPRRTAARGVAFVGIGPGAWLATAESGGNAFAAALKQAVGDLASVSDQSDGYAMLRLTGPKVRETLAKGVSVDLHKMAFQPGDVAATVVSHIGVTLWRIEDGTDGSPTFEIAVFRSLADSFGHWLCESAAEYGFIVNDHHSLSGSPAVSV